MRILIADDHAIVRKGLAGVLREEYPGAEVVEADDSNTLFKMALKGDLDLVVSDLSMPGRSVLEVIADIKHHFPRMPILTLSILPENIYGLRALKAGASGFLNKDASPLELKRAIRLVMQGRRYISPGIAEILADAIGQNAERPKHDLLTDRELHVMKLIASGEPLLKIGEMLSISPSTVSSYRSRILQKMQMQSNSDLTRYCIQHSLT